MFFLVCVCGLVSDGDWWWWLNEQGPAGHGRNRRVTTRQTRSNKVLLLFFLFRLRLFKFCFLVWTKNQIWCIKVCVMLMLNCDCSIVFMNKNLIFVALPCFSIRNLQKEKNPFFETFLLTYFVLLFWMLKQRTLAFNCYQNRGRTERGEYKKQHGNETPASSLVSTTTITSAFHFHFP